MTKKRHPFPKVRQKMTKNGFLYPTKAVFFQNILDKSSVLFYNCMCKCIEGDFHENCASHRLEESIVCSKN